MRDWHDTLSRLCCALFFERVVLRHGERVPGAGPLLFLGLHRNGAVDGFVYNTLLPGAKFLVSSQLRRSLLGRLFFTGIEVRRAKDASEGPDAGQALAVCAQTLKAGGRVFLFPEGTSGLGPRHLPFHSGPARLLHSLQASGVRVTVVPLAILYDNPQRWRSSVEVLVGEPWTAGAHGPAPSESLTSMRKLVQDSMESVAFEFDSAPNQESLQSLAMLLCRDWTLPYSEALRALSREVPAGLLERWAALRAEAAARGALSYKGAPAWEGRAACSSMGLALRALLAALGAALNLPPLLAGAWAGRRFPDGPNVVALWKILVGVPVFVGWALFLAVASLVSGREDLFAFYALSTAFGLHAWAPAHRAAASWWNRHFHPSLFERVGELREEVFRAGRVGPA